MRENEGVRFVIDITVKDVPAFKAAVGRCVEISRTEPGTLLYDWYLDEVAGKARLYEAYESIAAVMVHAAGPVFTEVGPDLLQSCEFVHMDAFGDVGDMASGPTFWPTTFWGTPFEGLTS